MKKLIIGALAMASTIAATAAEYQTDTFKTKGGKEVVITAIKHASLRIQYDGLEIQVDPVVQFPISSRQARHSSLSILQHIVFYAFCCMR